MIFFRYLAKEVYLTLAVVTGVLVTVFLSNQFVRYLGRAAAGKISGLMVLKIIAVEVPYLMGLLLPVGLFLAILLAYGRLYVDSEMTVLTACGLGRGQLLKMTMLFSTGVFLLVSFMSFYVNPLLMKYKDTILTISPTTLMMQTITPGRFIATRDGSKVFYVQEIPRDGKVAKNLFVAQAETKTITASDGEKLPVASWKVLSAQKAYEEYNRALDGNFVVAEDGYQYSGVPGDKAFRIVKFEKYGIRINQEAPPTPRQTHESYSTAELIKTYGKDTQSAAELQWRISLPLSVPILVLMAIPLSRVRPRQGRYAKLLPSILLYSIYANMQFVARDWVESGTVSPLIGMWWLHIALFLVSLVLFVDANRWVGIKIYLLSLWRRAREHSKPISS